MADINQIISLGIGTPADIEHFILLGLNANPAAVPVAAGGWRVGDPFGRRVGDPFQTASGRVGDPFTRRVGGRF